jgi:choline dehydrogenase-like flavoprotein
MIFDLAQSDQIHALAADVCIVGAGAAGIVLAGELLRQGKRVLLLESGGRKEEEAIQELNCSERTGQPLKVVHAGRFRSLGGSTTHWGGQISEFEAQDFEVHSGIPGSGWPIPKSVLQPYYHRAQKAEGLTPVLQTDEEVWQQAGMTAPAFGEGIVPYFTRWCPETNFARLHHDMLASPNLYVVLHASVSELLLDDAGDAVTGVRCRNLAGDEHVFRAPTYVLCLGMIETVQLLLQPLESGRAAPWQQNGLLGQHVQSHIDYNAARVVVTDRKRLEAVFPNVYLKGRKYHPKLRVTAERQQREEILDIAGAITFISLGSVERDVRQMKSSARNLLRGNWSAISVRDTLPALRRLPILMKLAYSFYVSHRAYWPQDVTYWLRVHCEQEPLSASRITLSQERDAMGMFRSRIDWQVSPLEWKTIQRFTQMARQALESAGLAKLEPQPELELADGYRHVTFDDSYHWMGGTRMSTSSTDGVVDTDLKIHGVRNLYVCSASVYPTSGFANPVHTLLALAIRLADHLAVQPTVSEGQQTATDGAASPVDTQVRADA